jgi:anti-anti-sigma factor
MSGQRVIISIPARIFPDIADHIQDEYAKKIYVHGAEYALDLASVNNVYSAVLNLIMHLTKEIAAFGGTTALVNVSERVKMVLHTMKIDALIPIYDTLFDYEFEHDTALIG